MVGNVKELNDPGNAFNRNNQYPNAYFTKNTNGCEPSIKAELYMFLWVHGFHTSKILLWFAYNIIS